MLCYQATAQFVFTKHKAVLVSTHIKKQKAKTFLVHSGLPFGSGLIVRRFFKTRKEAAWYVDCLHAVYKGRIVPNPAAMDGSCDQAHEFLQRKNSKLKISMDADFSAGQQYLFQEVSESCKPL
jgi:hypothetical protein